MATAKNNKQKIVIGSILAVAMLLIFRKKSTAQQEQDALQNESSNAGTPSYPNSQYFAWANQLETAMFDWGTDEAAIFNIFEQLNNNADFLKLKQAFGTRNYSGGIVPFIYGSYTLDEWFAEELNQTDIATINSILASKGIIYRV
jgi:hypothetical protein